VVPAGAVVRAGLGVGLALDRRTAGALARAIRHEAALRTATRALATRDLGRAELEGRLARAGIRDSARVEALDSLERAGLLDDGRFAAGRARSLAARGYGDAAIRADLERRGVDDRVAAAAIDVLEPEPDRAARALGRRARDRSSAGWLARRGFGDDAIECALGGVVAGEP
jgi:regulatory protein